LFNILLSIALFIETDFSSVPALLLSTELESFIKPNTPSVLFSRLCFEISTLLSFVKFGFSSFSSLFSFLFTF